MLKLKNAPNMFLKKVIIPMNKKSTFYIVMIVIYALISIIALYTPMHSDDFPYSLIGLSPSHHINHYLTWSGRVVADYASTIILSFNNHTISALLNSLGSTLLVYNIAMLPTSICKEINFKRVTVSAIIIFLTYWVSNPNLGQVMFWIVGSANYMWTTLFIVFFIRKSIEYREKERNKTSNIISLSLFGILAGLSNENTCLTLIICMIAICIYYRLTKGRVGKSLVFGSISSLIGASAMLLAPGNFARASGASLESWREMTLLQKLFKHLYITIPDVFSHIWVSIAIFMLSCAVILVSRKDHDKKPLALAFMFFMAFLCSNFIMFAAPAYPPRAMNGSFIFLLCALSVVLYSTGRMFVFTAITTISVTSFLFIPSYKSMYLAYKQTYLQSFVRSKIIRDAKSNNKDEVTIPGFYFTGLMKDSDKFDTYHSPYMASFYGMKKISAVEPPFDYSVLLGEYNYHLNVDIKGSIAKGVYSYFDKFRNESLFILEFNNSVNVPYSDDFMLFIKPILNGSVISKNTSLPMRTIDIGTRHFTYVRIKNIDCNRIEGIEFGSYKRSNGEVIFKSSFYK